MKDRIAELLQQAVDTLKNDGVYPPEFSTEITVENARDKGHGDFATNLAMKSCKPTGMKPRDLAERLVSAIPEDAAIAQVDIAGPGFINFFISDASSFAVVEQILQQGDGYGRSKSANCEKVQVEFVSANPTGPLHVGHGRGAAIGDCICRLLEATGHDVTREFYYNDAGAQIDNLARSVQARAKGLTPEAPEWPADGYRGEYILDVAEAYRQQATVTADDREVTAKGDVDDLEAIKAFAVAWLRREQDLDLKAFGVQFDVYFLESSLYQEGKVEEAVQALQTNGYTYEQDGALWLRTTDFGDDKDRVMRKSDGDYTYFVPDVAYHLNKWQRGYTTVINEQGADHHSTITRVRAGLQGLHAGIPEGWPDYVLHQMVTVTRSGEEVKISKRAGSYVTVRDLIEEVGRDATRYFLAARRAESQLTFDIDLARSRSNENPVYYIQYAHARICSMLRKLTDQGDNRSPEAFQGAQEALELDTERDLANTLARYPELVQYAASQHEPHQLAQYLRDLAGEFHTYYNAHKVLVDDTAVRDGRIALSLAVRQVIANGLSLLGVTAPERM